MAHVEKSGEKIFNAKDAKGSARASLKELRRAGKDRKSLKENKKLTDSSMKEFLFLNVVKPRFGQLLRADHGPQSGGLFAVREKSRLVVLCRNMRSTCRFAPRNT